MDRKAQDRINELGLLIDQLGDETDAVDTIMVETVEGDGTYPTTANVWYPVKRVIVGGTEEEGEPATFDYDGGFFLALHVGNTAPSLGVQSLATRCGGAWVFQS